MGEKREKKNTPPTETLSMDLFTYKCAYDGSDTLSICEGWELELGCFGPIALAAMLYCVAETKEIQKIRGQFHMLQ